MSDKDGDVKTVGVIGLGTMGLGIAQLAAVAGHQILAYDENEQQRTSVVSRMQQSLRKLEEKAIISRERVAEILSVVRPAATLGDFASCELVIEAIVEELPAKQKLFSALDSVVSPRCLLATNTSSLPVSAIAESCSTPERVLGIHFFNPAPLMPLVELVSGQKTAEDCVRQAEELLKYWGKTCVRVKDSPGFIVNRVARPFYLEPLRMLEKGEANPATVDWAMREHGGFPMGPFELMDFIGLDVNLRVTESIYTALKSPRYEPSPLQQKLVQAGALGKKSGKGFYDYRTGVPSPKPKKDPEFGRKIVRRVVSVLIDEAVSAVEQEIASAADIEVGMKKGVNYPKGLLAWGEEWGFGAVLSELLSLQQTLGEARYKPSPLLIKLASGIQKL